MSREQQPGEGTPMGSTTRGNGSRPTLKGNCSLPSISTLLTRGVKHHTVRAPATMAPPRLLQVAPRLIKLWAGESSHWPSIASDS